MKITPGVYEMRNGKKANVIRVDLTFGPYPCVGYIGTILSYWTISGRYTINNAADVDLIKRIGDLPKGNL